MNQTTKIALGILLMLALFMLFFRKKEQRGQFKPIEITKAMRKPTASPNPDFKMATIDPKLTRQYYRDLQVGFRELRYTTDERGQNFIKVTLKPSSSCRAGDYEAMRLALGKDGTMLLSLEPMTPDRGLKPSRKLISVSSIYDGTTVDLPVKKDKTGVYGLYLCSDGRHEGSCSTKKPADYHAIFGSRAAEAGSEAVFFFEPIVVQESASKVFSGQARDIPAARADLRDQEINSKNLEAEMAQAAAMMRQVKSLSSSTAMIGKDMSLVVPISTLDSQRCGAPEAKRR